MALDGTKFEGEFANDEVAGKGTLTLADGVAYSGLFHTSGSNATSLTYAKSNCSSILWGSVKKFVQKHEQLFTKTQTK